MKHIKLLLTLALVPTASMAFADDTVTRVKSTEANGTTVTKEASHSDSTSADGVRKSTEEETTVVNPVGAMNEKSATAETERVIQPNGDYKETDTLKHANGTVEKVTAEKSTAKHWTDKGKTTTITKSHSVDPNGLNNKNSVEEKVELDTAPNGTQKRTTTKTVNGKTVTENVDVVK